MENVENKNKAIFLDRDDTIIEDSGYINNPDQVKLISGVAKSLLEFREMGFKLIVVTNQSGIARGILTEKTLGEIHERINILLSEKGVILDGFYYCPFHPEGIVPQYRRESESRKPNPGMIITASQEHNIDLSQSWAIGNDSRDIDAGKRAGCKTILIETKSRTSPLLTFREEQPEADFRAVNMKEAVNIVKRHYRQIELQRKIENTARLERPRLRTTPPPPMPAPASVPAQVSAPAPAPASAVMQSQTAEGNIPMPARTSRRSRIVSVEPPAAETPKAEPPKTESHKTEETVQARHNIEEEQEEQNPQQLLASILRELQNIRRLETRSEFSIARLLAGLLQVVVFFCLLVGIWLTMQTTRRSDLILITLGFATVLQLMALTLYLMQNRK